MPMTEEEFDKLSDARSRMANAKRLVVVWDNRLEEAQRMSVQVRGELAQLEAEAVSLGAKAGLTPGPSE